MLHVDLKFANLIGPRIKNFSTKGNYVWQYTCPYCSDWTSPKRKARAYIYRKKTDLFTKCHHCGHGSNLGNLIKHFDEHLYKEYVVERYKDNISKYSSHKDISVVLPESSRVLPTAAVHEPNGWVDEVVSGLKKVTELPPDHPVYQYVKNRQIPEDKMHLFYYAPKFKAYVNECVREKFTVPIRDEHPRLILPFFDTHGRAFAIQARAFGSEDPKYYTIKVDENDEEKTFGLERVDYSKHIYVTEGPIDSLFLPNGLAVAGSSFDTPTIQKLKTNCTLVVDNEPRNKEITKAIAKLIESGYNCFLCPDNVPFKDINDMIKGGMTQQEVVELIDANSYQGLMAQLKFSQWKKC